MELTLKEFTENKDLDKSKVVRLYWSYHRLTILPVITEFINLTYLECNNNQLVDLSGISTLINLAQLDCSHNKLSDLSDISMLINLTHLYCYRNQLTDLSCISKCVKLTHLNCCTNQLVDLSGISTLINLAYLNCARNQLSSLPDISALVNLSTFIGYYNLLTNLSNMSVLVNLTVLDCSRNQLTDLSDISALINLINLTCCNNRLTALPQSIIACRRLRYFGFTDNPIEYIPPNIQRFIGRMRNTQTIGNIYNDSQSVHRSSVTNSVKKSIENLLSGKTELSSKQLIEIILKEPSLTDTVKGQIIQYMEDKEELSSSMITFEDVLSKVISRIIGRTDSGELFKILNEQMSEAECMCLTGRISRLVSVLDGFYDDIRIEVSSTEVISAIILQVTAVPGTAEGYKAEATRRLLESGHTVNEIEQWIAAIE